MYFDQEAAQVGGRNALINTRIKIAKAERKKEKDKLARKKHHRPEPFEHFHHRRPRP